MAQHHHHHELKGKNLFITIVLNVIITLAQVVGGLLSGSLALLSDALHNFSDVIALIIAWWAHQVASKKQTKEKTFGYKRSEIMATFFNASVLVGIGVYLIIESIEKFIHPTAINAAVVIWLGILSIILNSASVLLIKEDSHHSMNIRAAYLHLLTDVMTSVAVVGGGLLMYYFELFWVDPVISIFIALYLIKASLDLVQDSFSILMQFTPANIDVEGIQKTTLESNPLIENIHHLHIWRLDEHTIHLEAHLDFKTNITLKEANTITELLEEQLSQIYGINHTTFQCEYDKDDDKNLIVTSKDRKM